MENKIAWPIGPTMTPGKLELEPGVVVRKESDDEDVVPDPRLLIQSDAGREYIFEGMNVLDLDGFPVEPDHVLDGHIVYFLPSVQNIYGEKTTRIVLLVSRKKKRVLH